LGEIEPFQLAAEITLTCMYSSLGLPLFLFSKPATHMVLFFNFVMQLSWSVTHKGETWLNIWLQVKKDKILLQVKKDSRKNKKKKTV
jgi:hypothetical protein